MNKFHIVEDVLSKDIEQAPNRDGFGKGLLNAAKADKKVVGLCADVTGSVRMNWLQDELPDQYVEVGIAEQNLVVVGSGMAAMGMIPFVATYSAFNPGRSWEQVRTTVALNNQPVKVIGAHAGISVGPDGATHQMLEDIAIMRAIPNMTVIAPGDAIEARKATELIAKNNKPTYMRLAREASPIFTTENTPFSLDKAMVFSEGKDITFVSTGIMTYQALVAAEKLFNDGIDAEVIHVPVIKPLDGATIVASAQKTGAVITIEEHQINGGLGGAVAELLIEHHPVPMHRIGVNDRFGESGDPDKLMKKYGLDHSAIQKSAHLLLHQMGRE